MLSGIIYHGARSFKFIIWYVPQRARNVVKISWDWICWAPRSVKVSEDGFQVVRSWLAFSESQGVWVIRALSGASACQTPKRPFQIQGYKYLFCPTKERNEKAMIWCKNWDGDGDSWQKRWRCGGHIVHSELVMKERPGHVFFYQHV